MKNLKLNLGTALLMMILITTSCKNNNSNENGDSSTPVENHSEMDHNSVNGEMENKEANSAESSQTEVILSGYMELKDALVADNSGQAAESGKGLVAAFQDFDKSGYDSGQQQELTEIIEDAKEHAEHIAESDIAHQREHFDILSRDVADLLAITGAPQPLYQLHCPMYNDGKGAIWLSASEEVRNPYFGEKMLRCGAVQKEIL